MGWRLTQTIMIMKIASEMEVALRDTLLTVLSLLTLFTLFTLFALLTWFTL